VAAETKRVVKNGTVVPLAVKPAAPPRVDRYAYWTNEPPDRSARCAWWVSRFEAGWRPNRRVWRMGYDECAEYFGVYLWEYLNVISPLMNATLIRSMEATMKACPPRRGR